MYVLICFLLDLFSFIVIDVSYSGNALIERSNVQVEITSHPGWQYLDVH